MLTIFESQKSLINLASINDKVSQLSFSQLAFYWAFYLYGFTYGYGHYMGFAFRSHDNTTKQAGAELCQAQAQIGLTAEAELILMLSSIFSKMVRST